MLRWMCVVDEVSAVVLDVGSSSAKAGYAGDESPKAVFPTVGSTIVSAVSWTGRDRTVHSRGLKRYYKDRSKHILTFLRIDLARQWDASRKKENRRARESSSWAKALSTIAGTRWKLSLPSTTDSWKTGT